MDFDDINLIAFEELKREWIDLCSKSSRGVCELAGRYRKRDDCLLRSMHCGSFNFNFRLHWNDGGGDWLIRFPLPGKSMFSDEKMRNEVASMKHVFFEQNTKIPVPHIIGYGMAEENPTRLDCREKYACRHLAQAITPHFISQDDNYGPFKLFSDDLCPGNVLVDDSLQVTAAIDWEFCYAAPAQFAGSLPWLFVLERPPKVLNNQGLDAFLSAYIPKANLFLRAMELKEEARGIDATEHRLSTQMRRSLENSTLWFNLACRMVSSLDLIYWDLLDKFFWGPRSSIAERVHNFTINVQMHKDREDFVQFKIQQLREYHVELGEDEEIESEEKNTPNLVWKRRCAGVSANRALKLFIVSCI